MMKLLFSAVSALLICATSAKKNTSTPLYKDPTASVDDRVSDLLSRMTIQDKTAQLIQGDISNWINTANNSFNVSGLVFNMENRAGQFYVGYPVPQQWIADGVKIGQYVYSTMLFVSVRAFLILVQRLSCTEYHFRNTSFCPK